MPDVIEEGISKCGDSIIKVIGKYRKIFVICVVLLSSRWLALANMKKRYFVSKSFLFFFHRLLRLGTVNRFVYMGGNSIVEI